MIGFSHFSLKQEKMRKFTIHLTSCSPKFDNYDEDDNGKVLISREMSQDEIAGMCLMAQALFGQVLLYEWIEIEDENGDFLTMEEYNCDNLLSDEEVDVTEETWPDYIHELSTDRSPRRYTCLLTGDKTLTVSFDSLDGIKGALTLCDWLDRNPSDHIKFIHDDGNPIAFPFELNS